MATTSEIADSASALGNELARRIDTLEAMGQLDTNDVEYLSEIVKGLESLEDAIRNCNDISSTTR